MFGSDSVQGHSISIEGKREFSRGFVERSNESYLEDGDEVIFHGRAHRPGYASIGFGECRGTVTEALTLT